MPESAVTNAVSYTTLRDTIAANNCPIVSDALKIR